MNGDHTGLITSTCQINEPPIKNSGIIGGKYLRATLIVKPGSDPLNPDYYTPADFYIGATITVFQQRFKIVGADLYVYRYMVANASKFPCEVIDSLRNYMFNKGYLKDDLTDTIKDNLESERQWDMDTAGEDGQTEMEKCLQRLKVGGEGFDPEYEKATKDRIIQEYEEMIKHKSKVPPYGILPVNKSCAYPVYIGDVKSHECTENENEGEYTSYTPKHVDTPEEVVAKYYAGVLKDQKEVCDGTRIIECKDPPNKDPLECQEPPVEMPKPIMVSQPDVPPGACKIKQVSFADDADRCTRDRFDLCDLKKDKIHCDCIKYQKEC